MKVKISSIIPKYTLLPQFILIFLNSAVYWGTKLINGSWRQYDLTTAIDEAIPLVPFFVVFYVLAYIQWVVGYIIIARESEEVCYRVLSGEHISKIICFAFFLILPTAIVRPEVTGTGFFNWGVRIIYGADVPTNLFPSIHCLESWLCFRCSLTLKKVPKWYAPLMLFITLGVFASVVFMKQHFFVDIIAGVAVAELGQLISRLTGSGRRLERANEKLFRIGNQGTVNDHQ